ncbi:16S rRNA (guanine(527)-N(7))-methyltransferase RsmG [Erythrobacter insulae]|uniref:Ribosomal RNA small subunit methyltransferase G n=1 Tax=Erythrobacter insulae TaxID=2584124 RepID=A0A547PB54_9SPHN|nr:16S rRNA (guanine(527)-N(7))-methyltransferase RsmG [Erythrobacter insulae]TRD11365.1 16S rRNA (guanine(527)-N(7))-methyltransferase RsmG [Erythrobacter insulae]
MTALIETEEQARDYVRRMVDQAAYDRLVRFSELLLAENQRQNLISKPSEAQIWQRHFADSAQLLEHVSRETLGKGSDPWLDLGTGAGPPGLIIAVLMPDMPMKLVESRARRVEFLQACVDDLGLENCEVLGDRLERIAPFPASVISARAFAPLDKLLHLSAPFSTKATRYLLPKGRSAAHELNQQKSSIRKMFHVEQSLTDRDAGIIVSA